MDLMDALGAAALLELALFFLLSPHLDGPDLPVHSSLGWIEAELLFGDPVLLEYQGLLPGVPALRFKHPARSFLDVITALRTFLVLLFTIVYVVRTFI